MQLRDAAGADVPALHALQRAFDTAWFGRPEQSAAEVREAFELARVAAVVTDGGHAVGYAARWLTGAVVSGDPSADLDAVYALLLPWLESQGGAEVETLDRDVRLQQQLSCRGWRHALSAYDLQRALPVDSKDPLGLPAVWPEGITPRRFAADDGPALHDLVYTDAGWAQVEGHHARGYAEWHSTLLAGRSEAELPVVAWAGSGAGSRPAGAAVLRHFDDGTGWIAQLAVAREHQRRGLGKAPLVESFRRLAADGATTLGLGVSANNPGALELYRSVGLEIHRGWRTYRRPDATPDR